MEDADKVFLPQNLSKVEPEDDKRDGERYADNNEQADKAEKHEDKLHENQLPVLVGNSYAFLYYRNIIHRALSAWAFLGASFLTKCRLSQSPHSPPLLSRSPYRR